MVTKGEFYSHLQDRAESFAAVEEVPHEPAFADHFYAWKPPEGYKPTGEYLNGLLAYFDNTETSMDYDILRAALLTPFWGGPPGKRPAFVIMAPDRGYGKTSLTEAISTLAGGHIELNLTERAEERLVSRLLTPEALCRRIVRIDNIKGDFESELVESLVTTSQISGHRLFKGEATRPNTLTYFLTGNSLELSRDLSERSFIIRLKKPEFRPGWDDDLSGYITEYRKRIIADIIAELSKPLEPLSGDVSDRWLSWIVGVLSRVTTNIQPIIDLTKSRRGSCDQDLSDANQIMEAIDSFLGERHSHDYSSRASGDGPALKPAWDFISSTDMTSLLGRVLHENLTARAVKLRLDGHIGAGRLPRIKVHRSNISRGYTIEMPQNIKN
jgi:hypothetical protein